VTFGERRVCGRGSLSVYQTDNGHLANATITFSSIVSADGAAPFLSSTDNTQAHDQVSIREFTHHGIEIRL
jgi:hypothetical protein